MKIKEYNTRAKRSRKRTQTLYLSSEQKKEIITECGDAACLLFEYYLSKAGIPDFEFTDAKASNSLGWKQSKVKDVRLKLTKANYYHKASARYTDNRYLSTTYLGKAEVSGGKKESFLRDGAGMPLNWDKEEK